MNKIRKPGEHPGKGRIPGTRPISIKEIRNKKRMERIMADTASFISEKLQKIEKEYSAGTDLFNVLGTINKVTNQTAQNFVNQANNVEEDAEKVNTLHRCIVAILNTLQQAEQNVRMATVRYQHEVGLLNSMASELSEEEPEEEVEEEGEEEPVEEPEEGEDEASVPEDLVEEEVAE